MDMETKKAICEPPLFLSPSSVLFYHFLYMKFAPGGIYFYKMNVNFLFCSQEKSLEISKENGIIMDGFGIGVF
ncbi:hypothetical protein D3Z38_16475 [Clostridiales bacterium]|nr:hypothetical protein [Clostridiales bacterium]